jgi:cation transporter-like permease
MQWLTTLTGYLTSFTASQLASSIAVIAEIAFRVIPTQKPLSIIYLAEGVCTGLASFFSAVNAAMNKVIPQNVTAPVTTTSATTTNPPASS